MTETTVTVDDALAAVARTERDLIKVHEELGRLVEQQSSLPADTDQHHRDALARSIKWQRFTVREQDAILAGLKHRLVAFAEPAA